MKINGSVTADHIKFGCREDARNCPVSRALLDADCTDVSVSIEHTYIVFRDRFFSLTTPTEVARWIEEFDSHGTGDPFSFELEVP
jgi:hypothetical protein